MKIHTRFNPLTGGLVPLGEGLAVPGQFVAVVDDDTLGHLVTLEVVTAPPAAPRCSSITVASRDADGPPVDGRALRQIPVAEYVKRAVSAVAMTVEDNGNGTFTISPAAGVDHQATTAAYQVAGGRPGGNLALVANVYKEAHRRGEAPTAAVATVLNVSRATAGRRINEARKQGLLGRATPRKAGG